MSDHDTIENNNYRSPKEREQELHESGKLLPYKKKSLF